MSPIYNPYEDAEKYGPGCDETGKVNYALPPRGVSGGKPPAGLRNHDCRVDGHSDPDNSGSCIYCGKDLDGGELSNEDEQMLRDLEKEK